MAITVTKGNGNPITVAGAWALGNEVIIADTGQPLYIDKVVFIAGTDGDAGELTDVDGNRIVRLGGGSDGDTVVCEIQRFYKGLYCGELDTTAQFMIFF